MFHVSRLKPHTDPSFCRHKANLFPKMLRGEEVYEIDWLTDHDYKFGVQWYKVAWKGFSEVYESTWEPRTELMKNASKLVLKYEQENKLSLEDPERWKKRRR